jgi:hypothetical protein
LNVELSITQTAFLRLYHDKVAYLIGKPRRVLEDLLHEAEENIHAETFSLRASAEINRAACLKVLGRLA